MNIPNYILFYFIQFFKKQTEKKQENESSRFKGSVIVVVSLALAYWLESMFVY